ncbi:hypothetical protein [Streptomyces sp. NPDC046261]|uniref:hypothetical protein n=1 Tax=Streptomyces sp. NPDC046261 TaxID=3157200 RepID=UPI0033EFC15D
MRRMTLVSASATALCLCLGAALTGCGGSDRDGYVATGAAGPGASRPADRAVPPKGGVELVPLDGAPHSPARSPGPSRRPAPTRSGSPVPARPAPGAATGSPGGTATTHAPHDVPLPATSGDTGLSGGNGDTPPARTSRPSRPSPPSRPAPPAPSGPTGPGTPAPAPAALEVGEPRREPGPDRWCEQVTLTFANTGGSPVTAGTVTLGTHIIGAFGTDWATISSSHPLPAPIEAGRTVEATFPVCVDAWRVLPGMRIETRDVSVDWA